MNNIYIKARLTYAQGLTESFKNSVLIDGGVFEAQQCLINDLKKIL